MLFRGWVEVKWYFEKYIEDRTFSAAFSDVNEFYSCSAIDRCLNYTSILIQPSTLTVGVYYNAIKNTNFKSKRYIILAIASKVLVKRKTTHP